MAKRSAKRSLPEFPLSFFACPNSDCADSSYFDAGNLSIAERMARIKPSADYIARPADTASANMKFHSWGGHQTARRNGDSNCQPSRIWLFG